MRICIPDTMMQKTPNSARAVIRPSVRMLESTKTMTKATATKTAVHTAWVDSALKAMEMLSMAEPAHIM